MEEENKVAPAQAENAPQEPVKEPEKPIENQEVTLPKEKVEDWKRKLTGSKMEALRLKQEKERFEAEAARLQAELNAAKSGQGQSYGYQPYKSTPEEIDLFKQLARQAGVPLKEELEHGKEQEYANTKNEVVMEFLEKHPEYAEAGNPESDALWAELKSAVESYIPPKNAKDYAKLLEKEHKLLHFDSSVEKERSKALALAQVTLAEQNKIGGTGGGSDTKSTPKLTPEKKAIMDGFKQAAPHYFS